MNSGIYKLMINGKKYVGCTTNFVQRFKEHRQQLNRNTHINPHLQYAYNKHNQLDFEILEECIEWIYKKEMMWIEKENSYKNGYNMTEGGECPNIGFGPKHHFYGKHLSAEHRKKIGDAQRGIPKPGTSAGLKINNPMFQEKTLQKLRELNTGKLNPSYRHDITREVIMPFVADGWDRNKIARHFRCSPHTIKTRIFSF